MKYDELVGLDTGLYRYIDSALGVVVYVSMDERGGRSLSTVPLRETRKGEVEP